MRKYQVLTHFFLISFIILLFLPLYFALVAASHDGNVIMQGQLPLWPGTSFYHNMKTVLLQGTDLTSGQPVWRLLGNSFIMASLIAIGKIILALFTAFALVYTDLPGKKIFFALIFMTMMLPVEVRIVPTFEVVASLGWLNQFTGLTLPLMASATATFLFRQFFKTIPRDLVEAAKIDGAGAWRFFYDIVLPLSKTQITALFIILFVYGWNQYLWPLLITTDGRMTTIVMGIRYLAGVADEVPQWHSILCVALLAMLPPCLLVLILRRWFEQGLTK